MENQNQENEKSRPLSLKQKETLIEYVHSKPEMYRGTFSATYTYATSVILWKQITDILNAIPGGLKKDWKQWRKTFVDLKKNTKSKFSKLKAHSQGTGGGPPLPPPTDKIENDTEEKILAMITPVAISGNLEVPEPTIIYEDLEDSVAADHIYVWENPPVEVMPSNEFTEFMPDQPVLSEPGTSKEKISKQPLKERPNNHQARRTTKSQRLSQSVRNNKDFLAISQKGISSTENYRNKKLELLRTQVLNQEQYYKEKLELLRQILLAFTSIASNFSVGQDF